MKLIVKKGTTSKILRIFVQDSSKTDGSGLAGLVHNTASLTAYYIREGAASATVITLVNAVVGTYTSSGFKEVDAANMPGVYELHPPNACLASGADSVVIFLKGAANMAPIPIEIQLDDNTSKDIYDRVGSPAGASIAADVATRAPSSTALTNVTWTDAKAAFIDAAISGRAPANEYNVQMGYIPSNLGDVPTDSELDASHGAGSWESAVPPTVDAIADAVWDEILTGATHNIATSAGRRVREIGAFAIHSGTAQAGNSHSITLAATADANDGVYNRNLIVLTDNTGVGQTRTVVDYDGTTKVVVVDRDWRVSPDATTAYQIVPDDTPLTVDHGIARGGTNRTITIRAYASSVDDAYLCNIVTIIAGKGRGQARLVGAYDGTTNVVTICGDDWVDIPNTTSVYVMMPYGVACAACMGDFALDQMGDAVWDEDLTTHTTSKTAGWFVQKIKAIADAILAMVT